MTKPWRNKEWLTNKYIDERLTTLFIARLAGCSSSTIQKWIRKLDIPHRTQSEALRGRLCPRPSPVSAEYYQNKEWLIEMYISRKLTIKQISLEAKCSSKTIWNWMDKFGIERRTDFFEKRGLKVPIYTQKWWLQKHYCDQQLSIKTISELADCCTDTIWTWLQKLDIPLRSYSEAGKIAHEEGLFDNVSEKLRQLWASGTFDNRDMSMENNPNWQGGISFQSYPIEFSDDFKEKIRERDNYRCAICRFEAKDVHHIDYRKENTYQENCITLCRSCHMVTNYNREYWEVALSKLMAARIEYGGSPFDVTRPAN